MTSEIRQDTEPPITTATATATDDPRVPSTDARLRSRGGDAPRPESRHRALSTTSSDASHGSIHYEPERRRIIWEASHHVSEHYTITPEDFSPGASTPVTPSESSGRSFRDFPSGAGTFEHGSPSKLTTPQSYPAGSELQHISEPCRIRWHSTVNLPFDEVRGLRNPWNENKEVHVARNVTAVEPDAGEMLLVRWRRKDEARRTPHSSDALSKAWPTR